MIFRMLLRAARPALAAAALMSGAANAEDYPSREIHFICGFPAGTGADTIVRYYAEKLRPIIGRTILVENRPGAGVNTATEHAAKSKPDS
jgi:tripartite-type tricarboxylate transporter receptor subunit TctC